MEKWIIINSLVNDIIMPVITLITGGIDFTNWFVSLDGSKYATLAKAQEAPTEWTACRTLGRSVGGALPCAGKCVN